MKEVGPCCICDDDYTRFGHNPDPISLGREDRCCDFCNSIFVTPARMGVVFKGDDLKEIAKVFKSLGPEKVTRMLTMWQLFTSSPRQKPGL